MPNHTLIEKGFRSHVRLPLSGERMRSVGFVVTDYTGMRRPVGPLHVDNR